MLSAKYHAKAGHLWFRDTLGGDVRFSIRSARMSRRSEPLPVCVADSGVTLVSRANPGIEVALWVAAGLLGAIALLIQFRVGLEWQVEGVFLGSASVLLILGLLRDQRKRDRATQQSSFLELMEMATAFGLLLATFLSLAVVGILLVLPASRGSLRFFPGDPPCADLALALSSLALVLCALAFLLTRWWAMESLQRLFRVVLAVVSMTVAGCLVISGGIVLYRFSPTWKPIRQLAEERSDTDIGISDEEFIRGPVEVHMSGFGPVQVLVTGGAQPLISVDFGEGRNAGFDPATMICRYSD